MHHLPPLSGLSIVNSRAAHQAQPLTSALEALGASVYHYPAIRILPPADPSALDAALAAVENGGFDWLLLTSTNTVQSLAQRLAAIGAADALRDSPVRVAAIGPATADAAESQLGLSPSLLPDEFVAESLVAALTNTLALKPGARVLLPQSALARPLLADALASLGAQVTQLDAYRTVAGQGGDPVPHLFWEGRIDAVTFTSPSTVHNFLKRLKAEDGSAAMLVDVVVACIGPQTAAAAAGHDLRVQVVPEKHTVEGLVEALAHHYTPSHSG